MACLTFSRWKKRYVSIFLIKNEYLRSYIGSFQDWKVLLLVEKARAEGFGRVLRAGHARVTLYSGEPTDLQVNIKYAIFENPVHLLYARE